MRFFEIQFPYRFEKLYFAEIRFPYRFDFLIDLEFWADFHIDLNYKLTPKNGYMQKRRFGDQFGYKRSGVVYTVPGTSV